MDADGDSEMPADLSDMGLPGNLRNPAKARPRTRGEERRAEARRARRAAGEGSLEANEYGGKDEIGSLCQAIGLPFRYSALLAEFEVRDMETLRKRNMDDMVSCGIRPAHARRLLNAVVATRTKGRIGLGRMTAPPRAAAVALLKGPSGKPRETADQKADGMRSHLVFGDRLSKFGAKARRRPAAARVLWH
jgi:hypothetical protein